MSNIFAIDLDFFPSQVVIVILSNFCMFDVDLSPKKWKV